MPSRPRLGTSMRWVRTPFEGASMSGASLGKVGHLEVEEGEAGNELSSSLSRRRKWLGDLDSNQDSQIQNLESYRWTISHPLWRKTSHCTFSETNTATTLPI